MQILAKPNNTPSETEISNRAMLNAMLVKKRGTAQTPLENALSTTRLTWLAQYAKARFDSYYGALSGWRTKLEKYELQSEDAFGWRAKEGNRNSGKKSIFEKQNDSLNVVGAFSEYFTAQAKNDLFGSTPWFAAKPEGKADSTLSDQLSKHSAWKLRHSGLVETYNESVKLASDLGTCFVKKTWLVRTDSFEETVTYLQDTKTKKPVYTTTGELILSTDQIDEQYSEDNTEEPESSVLSEQTPVATARFPRKDPKTDLLNGSFEYVTGFRKQDRVTYRNVKAVNLHYKDVAFDPMAPELDLHHTDFFCRFTKGLNDIRRDYNLSREDAYRIYNSMPEKAEANKPMSHREEAAPEHSSLDEYLGALPNIQLRLVEGFMRVDATGRNQAANIYIVFCPEIDLVLRCNYLANVTPKGLLPIHSHTVNRTPFRIVGRGFFEHLEMAQTVIDDSYNRINYHDRKRSTPITGLDKTQLKQEDEEEDEAFDPDKPVNLKSEGQLEKYIQFKDLPDLSERTTEMMHLMIQMVQLRKGITAASQGDMTGLPENNTATGIKQLMSRAAVLLKAPIDDFKRSFTKDLYYTLKLLYSNFDRDEAFVYGEGENMELIEVKADQVRDLEIDIELLLTQAQNTYKLENAKAGIELFTNYSSLQELDKQFGRSLYIQALRALDFADADQIIRPAAVDLNAALALLPPEVAQQVVSALNSPFQGSPK